MNYITQNIERDPMLLSYRSMIPMFRETKLVGQSPVIPT